MNINERNKLLPSLARLSPAISIIIFLIYIIYDRYNIVYLTIVLGIISLSNQVIKEYISRPLYNIIPKLNKFIQGSRPVNAVSCGLFLDGKKGSRTFGMPSGHSQIIWSITIYILLKLWNKEKKNKLLLWFISIVLILYALYVSYSRVYIDGCHTLPQVIIGSLIGILLSSLIYYLEVNIFYKN